MSARELLSEIQKLPIVEQEHLLQKLTRSLNEQPREPISEDEVQRILFEKGIIGNIPDSSAYTDEDEDFEPIEVVGKPLSETIIEERR